MLNDDCLGDILKFLQLEDFINLAETCSRLIFVAQQYKKFRNIAVRKYWKTNGSPNTEKEFSNILSVIGEHVSSINIYPGNVTKTIIDNCSNLSSVMLEGPSSKELSFQNLKELKVMCYASFTGDWRKCFENNPGIENLEYCDYGRNNCLPLLRMLPELKSLRIVHLTLEVEEFNNLSCLTGLTRLWFSSFETYNQLLIHLSEKLNLVELDFTMNCDADTFAILQSFLHLEVLSVVYIGIDYVRVPESTIFPTMLKKIKLDRLHISCSLFLSTAKKLKLLEEFDMGCDGKIFSDSDECKSFNQNYMSSTQVMFVFQPNISHSNVGTKMVQRLFIELQRNCEQRKKN